jgi:hypothetical protein
MKSGEASPSASATSKQASTDRTHVGVEIYSTEHCFSPICAIIQAQFLLRGSNQQWAGEVVTNV